MARALCISMFALLLLGFVSSAGMAQQKRSISQESFERMIEIEPLVFQGLVTKVDVILVTPKQLYAGARGTAQMPVTEVTMKIEKIIAGEYDSHEIRIILPEGETEKGYGGRAGVAPMKVKVGDHAIVGFKLDAEGTGFNLLERDDRFFKVEGKRLIPYRDGLYLDVDKPFDVMAKKAKEREMPEVVKASDLICIGTVTRLIDLH